MDPVTPDVRAHGPPLAARQRCRRTAIAGAGRLATARRAARLRRDLLFPANDLRIGARGRLAARKNTKRPDQIGGGKPGRGRKPGIPNKANGLLKDAIIQAAEVAGGREGIVGYLTQQARHHSARNASMQWPPCSKLNCASLTIRIYWATAALRLKQHARNSSGIICVALAQVGSCLSRLQSKNELARTSTPGSGFTEALATPQAAGASLFWAAAAPQRQCNFEILIARWCRRAPGGAPHGSIAPRSIATGNRSGIICVALVHLEAVHDGHERSEFGRMQASRRPNQR